MITTEDKLYLEELKAINENLASLINKVEDLYKEIKVQENHLKDSPHMSL